MFCASTIHMCATQLSAGEEPLISRFLALWFSQIEDFTGCVLCLQTAVSRKHGRVGLSSTLTLRVWGALNLLLQAPQPQAGNIYTVQARQAALRCFPSTLATNLAACRLRPPGLFLQTRRCVRKSDTFISCATNAFL